MKPSRAATTTSALSTSCSHCSATTAMPLPRYWPGSVRASARYAPRSRNCWPSPAGSALRKRDSSAPADLDAGLPGRQQGGVSGDGDVGCGGASTVPQVEVEAGGGGAHRAPGVGCGGLCLTAGLEETFAGLDGPGVAGV